MSYISKEDIEKLVEVREMLEMKDCNFKEPDKSVGIYQDFTSKVDYATRIWRVSWVFPLLDEVIEKVKERDVSLENLWDGKGRR